MSDSLAQTAEPQPLVSVLMITYNHRPYIERAIEDVLKQETDFPVELIVADDCSTDGTRDVVREWQRRHPGRIRAIMTEQNVGMRANLLRTERAARGKYVAYCEGDDFWQDRTKLARQVAFLEAHPDYSMVHSHSDRFYVQTGKLARNSLQVPRGLDDARAYEDIMTNRRYPLTVTVVARNDALQWILDHCPECTDGRWPMGDTQRWLELARRGRVGCIHESLATTNVLAESAGQSRDKRKRLKFYLKGRELKLHYLEKYPVDPELARVVREKLALVLLHHAFEARDAEAAEMLYRDYRANTRRPAWRARWLVWGCGSPVRRMIAGPLMRAERRWRNARLRLRLAAALDE